jgi:hypothetical protein
LLISLPGLFGPDVTRLSAREGCVMFGKKTISAPQQNAPQSGAFNQMIQADD